MNFSIGAEWQGDPPRLAAWIRLRLAHEKKMMTAETDAYRPSKDTRGFLEKQDCFLLEKMRTKQEIPLYQRITEQFNYFRPII